MAFAFGRMLVVLLATGLVAASCGSDDSGPADVGDAPVQAVTVGQRQAGDASPTLAGEAIADFGIDLFTATRALDPSENVTVSPASVAIAWAMLEPGTSGEAQTQLRELLRIDDPAAFHASMNALEQNLEARVPAPAPDDQDPGEVTVRVANAAYLQQGYPFAAAYLDTVGANYGPVLNEVDFMPDPDAIAHLINDFIAENTNDKIVDLIDDGVIKPETVLALVNALYLKASWQDVFAESATADAPFTTAAADTVTVPMMQGIGASSARGDGWIGATKAYVGGLSAEFILPDEGRFDEIADDLGAVFDEYQANRTGGGELGLPRFESRFRSELTDALMAMGLTAPYVPGGLLGVANDPLLVVDKVLHETFVAMDEEGTEAAAATVILAFATSAPAVPPVAVILDRPFIYRIVDDQSGATLFVGQILDPTA